MTATSIENVLDFIFDFNALVGVHQYPVDQQLGQLGGQRICMLSTISRIRSLLVCFSAMMISFQKK